ncbi:LacI family DNA-binding transcriptional regulator [Prosthecomicrobium sp. N25]|uniref:LacI family DNA-binding transcriptional regulator n=1 Tax=Prosthecomicrobium sp. N25 TaxID=3129254 RepID=UPI003076B6EE
MAKPREPRRPATIVDIARAAGVSKSTVSLVLKGSPQVKPETRERVERASAQLGYVYNRGAASLRTATSRFVGMIISDLMNPFFAELAVGIEEAIYKLGYVPILANTNEDRDRQAEVLKTMREYGVGGIIMSPARGTTAWTLAEFAAMPMVITMRRVEGSPLPYVGPDNRSGEREATAHLIGLGHRDIAYLGGYDTMTTMRERLDGYRDALLAAGLPYDPAMVFEAMPTRAGGREAVAAAFAGARRPTAFVTYNDIVAIGAAQWMSERGLVIGRDVSIVGFDNIAEAQHNAPPLTTVDGNTMALGAQAAEVLLARIEGRAIEPVEFYGPTRLVLRRSCGPAPSTLARITA